jgi:hypothetical protein
MKGFFPAEVRRYLRRQQRIEFVIRLPVNGRRSPQAFLQCGRPELALLAKAAQPARCRHPRNADVRDFRPTINQMIDFID